MSNRKQFETAWSKVYPLHGQSTFKRSGFNIDEYASPRVQDGWLMWQASRATPADQCCRQRPCFHPGKAPCDMPAPQALQKRAASVPVEIAETPAVATNDPFAEWFKSECAAGRLNEKNEGLCAWGWYGRDELTAKVTPTWPNEVSPEFQQACAAAFKYSETGGGPCGVFIAGYRALVAAVREPKLQTCEISQTGVASHEQRHFALLERAHTAIDILLAQLITADPNFRGTSHPVWPTVVAIATLLGPKRAGDPS